MATDVFTTSETGARKTAKGNTGANSEAESATGAAETSGQRNGTPPPPRGWQMRGEDEPSPEAIAAVLEKLVELLPPDLQQRLTRAVHELLEAIRALIEWWITRLEQRTAAPVPVRDIPIL